MSNFKIQGSGPSQPPSDAHVWRKKLNDETTPGMKGQTRR